MDLSNLNGLKDGIENLMKNVKAEALTENLPDMDELKEQLGKLEGLKGLFDKK